MNKKQSEYAPIVVFVYRRLKHTKQIVEALQKNPESKESDIFFFSDAPKDVCAMNDVCDVREYLHSVDGFRSVSIVEQSENLGIEKSEILGISEVINEYGRVIVIEDDIEVSDTFLHFVNIALNRYEQDERVASITGYSFIDSSQVDEKSEYAFTQLTSAWGWATWKDRWDDFDEEIDKKDLRKLFNIKYLKKYNHGFDYADMFFNQLNRGYVTWDIQWYWVNFIRNRKTLFPINTMVNNIGMDGSGVHYSDPTQVNRIENINRKFVDDFPNEVEESQAIWDAISTALGKESDQRFDAKYYLKIWKKLLRVFVYGI